MSKNILILGATSKIAEETAKIFAREGHRLFLVGRNNTRLAMIADHLSIQTQATVGYKSYDLADCAKHAELFAAAIDCFGDIDIVLIAHSSLSDQKSCEKNFVATQSELQNNLLSTISLLTWLGNYFEARKQGCIAVISSVAGDRGRQSNYVYGTTKAAINTYLQGLRNRLRRSNVTVLTIKPGFVDTPMIQHLKKNLLWTQPNKVAKKIVSAIYRNKQIVYVPGYWRGIMWIIKMIPERIFCQLKL